MKFLFTTSNTVKEPRNLCLNLRAKIIRRLVRTQPLFPQISLYCNLSFYDTYNFLSLYGVSDGKSRMGHQQERNLQQPWLEMVEGESEGLIASQLMDELS